MTERFFHVVESPNAANVARAALATLGREEEVSSVHEALHMGPIGDVDEGGAVRLAWWKAIYGDVPVDARCGGTTADGRA